MNAEISMAGNWLPDDDSARDHPPGRDGAMGAGGERGNLCTESGGGDYPCPIIFTNRMTSPSDCAAMKSSR
jgi:hypothetical protein